MAGYAHTFVIKTDAAGQSLCARLLNVQGQQVGSDITTGFVDLGDGYYLWTYDDFDETFRGAVAFYDTSTSPPTLKAVAAINPEVLNLLAVPLAQQAYPVDSMGRILSAVGRGIIHYITPIFPTGEVTIHQGDDYLAMDNRALEWTEAEGGAQFPDLSGATVKLYVSTTPVSVFDGTVVSNTPPRKVRVELTHAQTANLPAGAFLYELKVSIGETPQRIITVARGTFNVIPQISAT